MSSVFEQKYIMEYLHQDKTEKIIQAFFKVYNIPSTRELWIPRKSIPECLVDRTKENGFWMQKSISDPGILWSISCWWLFCWSRVLGIDDCIIIENKAAEALVEENEFQLINYLKATNIEVGLLLNFGKRPEFKRKIFTNDRKK